MEKVIVYGIGWKYHEIYLQGGFNDYEILALCDKDIHKKGQTVHGKKIVSPYEINKIYFDKILVTSEKYFEEIKKELVSKGIKEEQINLINSYRDKYNSELAYWKNEYFNSNGVFYNSHYKKLMLDIAQKDSDEFLKGKVVVDFGCGPKGSLAWTNSPAVKIGVDVLVDKYFEEFGDFLALDNTIYVKSNEKKITLPTNFVDYLYTINSLDHVDNLNDMVMEILRIIKPGGYLLGSFNLNEPESESEPQTLTFEILKEILLNRFEIEMMKLAYKDEKDTYYNMKNGNFIYDINKMDRNRSVVLWIKGRKR